MRNETIAEILEINPEQVELTSNNAVITIGDAVITLFFNKYGRRKIEIDVDLRSLTTPCLMCEETEILRDIWENEEELSEAFFNEEDED